ncbi:MAG: methyltransferase domain-containing protein [Oscillospiraceae bacterium]|nr:methyltransferase domain-containing protein [Oscillospiraceae bacterium]
MNKHEVAAFFDELAPHWDERAKTEDEKIRFILDIAGICENAVVLDAACGTGVLFPYYLKRNVSRIIGVDISPEMLRAAAAKYRDARIETICADMETLPAHRKCDCCVVYNALPHFPDPVGLIRNLAEWAKPGGRLTVAHGMSLEALKRHHAGRAKPVSKEMLRPDALAAICAPWFSVDTEISDSEMYVVSGMRRMQSD